MDSSRGTNSTGTGTTTSGDSKTSEGDAGNEGTETSDAGTSGGTTNDAGDDGDPPETDVHSSTCKESGDGEFCVGDSPVDMLATDVDDDGCPDLLAAAGLTNEVTLWHCPGGAELESTNIAVHNGSINGSLAYDDELGHLAVLFLSSVSDGSWISSLEVRDVRMVGGPLVQDIADREVNGPRFTGFWSGDGNRRGLLMVRQQGQLTALHNSMGMYVPDAEHADLLGGVTAFSIADINGDTIPEVFYAGVFGEYPDEMLGLVVRYVDDFEVGTAIVTELDRSTIGPAALGNLDDEGSVDAVVLGVDSIDFVPGNGDGTFGFPVQQDDEVTDGTVRDVAVGDLNDDAVDEVIVPYCQSEDDEGDGLKVLTWGQAPTIISLGLCPTGIEVDDFDEDGRLDAALLMKSTDSIILVRGDGSGSFEPW